ncbi:MAG: hypothetical protein HC838_08410 [Spirulinaceae cyanobacterium RM2_2_10]|nr:hypothetical protein [Spirulinaceae cyanobacterium RM2_2_10]
MDEAPRLDLARGWGDRPEIWLTRPLPLLPRPPLARCSQTALPEITGQSGELLATRLVSRAEPPAKGWPVGNGQVQ